MVGGLALAGCGSPSRPTIRESSEPVSGEPTARSLQQLLNRRAEALKKGDERAFLADLDESNDELIQQQRMVFANLRKLKIATFHYLTERSRAPRRAGEAYRFGPVHEVLQLSADAGPGGVSPAATFRITVVRRDAKLVITEMLGVTQGNRKELGLDGLPADAPWYQMPLKVLHAGNVCLISDTKVADLDRYAAVAQDEARYVEELWGDRTRFPGHVLFFTRDEATFAKWFGLGSSGNFQPTIEGFEIPQFGVRKNGEIYTGQYAGARVVVNLKRIESFDDSPRRVMRHELTHAVSARATTIGPAEWLLGAPRWALEGFARWAEGTGAASRRYAAGRFKGKLPSSTSFYGSSMAYNYAVSSTVFSWVERLKGRAAAVEFYEAVIQYNDMTGEPLVETPVFNAICKRVLGMSTDGFKQRWATYVRTGA
ncbi:hypothetical protein ACIBPB_00745 [Micromonospora sp. NPDC049836]|uniref:hypothetical protein n=1 Tax=Micromonospora sp. NPDC049836 TaxID=3364274 RepID=UPI0037BB0C4B